MKKAAVFAAAALVVVACGSNKPEVASTPASPPPPEPAVAPVETKPAPPAETKAPEPEPAAAKPAEPPPATGGEGVPEAKDECTPVGVDFEKRARPKLKECYQIGKKKDPNLEGTVKIKITVDVKGKIKSTKVVEKTLPDPVANCMLKAIQTTPFPEVDKCWDATLTIPVTFPTPK